jgi:high affinity Mn2+ porin
MRLTIRKHNTFILIMLGISCRLLADNGKDSARFQLHFQQTIVTQYHPDFSAKYTGPNSMLTSEDQQTSLTSTFFAGLRLAKNTFVYFNPEIAGGSGLSKALGAAGFPNGETFRVGNPKPQVYVARIYISHYISLGNEKTGVEDDFNQLAGYFPKKYIHLVAGRFAISDFFDNNSYSHDPRTQFFNWSLMSNGAYDYAANTRGYTWGGVAELGLDKWVFRIGAGMVPTSANASTMDGNIKEAHALQAEADYNWGTTKKGTVRLLVYQNAAHMGNYQDAVSTAKQDGTNPDITTTRSYGRTKSGIGINIEQRLTNDLGMFARASWNDGINETWMFTEIDQSASIGLLGNASFIKRPKDIWGIATVVNGISKNHQQYLAAGGTGFMIGDGALNYAPETILELFYNSSIYEDHFFITPDYQFVLNPAYNKDRGPIHVLGIRVHVRI